MGRIVRVFGFKHIQNGKEIDDDTRSQKMLSEGESPKEEGNLLEDPGRQVQEPLCKEGKVTFGFMLV